MARLHIFCILFLGLTFVYGCDSSSNDGPTYRAPADISIENNYFFGIASNNMTYEIKIKNEGTEPLKITNINSSKPDVFALNTDDCMFQDVPGRDNCTLGIIFQKPVTGATTGSQTGKITIYSNDKEDPITNVQVSIYLGDKWSLITPPTNATVPEARYGSSMVSIGTNTYLFGGTNDTVYFSDIWSIDYANDGSWEKRNINTNIDSPEGRSNSSIFNRGTDIYIFGGISKHRSEFMYFNDLWSITRTGTGWDKLIPSGTPPAKEKTHLSNAVISDDTLFFISPAASSSSEKAVMHKIDLEASRIGWAQVHPHNFPNFQGFLRANVAIDDKIYVFGKTDTDEGLWVYDTDLNTFAKVALPKTSALPVIGDNNIYYTAVRIGSGFILFLGNEIYSYTTDTGFVKSINNNWDGGETGYTAFDDYGIVYDGSYIRRFGGKYVKPGNITATDKYLKYE